jgi:hypothetical protein
MLKKRFLFVLSIIISTSVLIGPSFEVNSYDIDKPEDIDTPEIYSSVATNEYTEEQVIEKVLSYVSMHQNNDPLIEVEPHILVKRSNIEGIVINGQIYFYSLFPHASFDPVALGKVSENEVTIIHDDKKATIPVIIYTMK